MVAKQRRLQVFGIQMGGRAYLTKEESHEHEIHKKGTSHKGATFVQSFMSVASMVARQRRFRIRAPWVGAEVRISRRARATDL